MFLCPVCLSPHPTPPHLSVSPEPPEVPALVTQLHGRLWNHQDSGGKRRVVMKGGGLEAGEGEKNEALFLLGS